VRLLLVLLLPWVSGVEALSGDGKLTGEGLKDGGNASTDVEYLKHIIYECVKYIIYNETLEITAQDNCTRDLIDPLKNIHFKYLKYNQIFKTL